MAAPPILITSFQPWRSHQLSNSSDDLIAALTAQNKLPKNSIWIRNVPVSFELAPIRVISELYRYRPQAIICCGMAENRPYLSIEQRATQGSKQIQTTVDLQRLLETTRLSTISYNAGNYVCNALYYSVLESIQKYKLPTVAVFAHVPVLKCDLGCDHKALPKEDRSRLVLEDFTDIANRLANTHSLS